MADEPLYRFTFRPGPCRDRATGRPIPVDVRLAKLLKYAGYVGLKCVDQREIKPEESDDQTELPPEQA